MFKLFDLTLKLNGFQMKKAKAELNAIVSFSEEEHRLFIETKKKEIVDFYLQHNTYYREFVGKSTVENWAEVPVMQKKDFQKPLAERISEGYTVKSIYVNKTSGSSGDPFIFAKDKYSHALTVASNINRFGW